METTTTIATPAGGVGRTLESEPRGQALVPGWVSRWSTAIMALPVLFWAAHLALAVVRPNAVIALAVENGVLETIQHLTLLAAVVVATLTSLTLKRRGDVSWTALYAVGALVLFWLLGEEISWGQHYFGWDTPEALSANLQGESNLHNLPGVTVTLHYAVMALIPVFVIASIALWRKGGDFATRWRLPLWMPHPVLVPAWLVFWSYTPIRMFDIWYFELEGVRSVVSKLQEVAETVLYAGVMGAVVMAWWYAKGRGVRMS